MPPSVVAIIACSLQCSAQPSACRSARGPHSTHPTTARSLYPRALGPGDYVRACALPCLQVLRLEIYYAPPPRARRRQRACFIIILPCQCQCEFQAGILMMTAQAVHAHAGQRLARCSARAPPQSAALPELLNVGSSRVPVILRRHLRRYSTATGY